MKQIWPNYSYSPATNVLTLTGLNIDRDQLLLVGAPERGRIMYNFADSAVTASAYTAGANTALTLVASTAGLTTTASLVIYYDDQLQSTAITISNFPATQPVSIASVTIGNTVTIAGTVTANPTGTQTIAGTVTALNLDAVLDQYEVNAQEKSFAVVASLNVQGYVSDSAKSHITNSVTIGSLPAISGTVTANSSNGSLTTRFGSVTTANTAFATSAVTNANRKYLLIQNVTTASNVITVGVGFTPTTTQGIQLTAGAGLTFEGNYIPTGAVNLLSSVTASCFTILEA